MIAKKYGVSDKIKFLGPISPGEIFQYLDNIDIYIQPSKTEGLPRALVEAMSRGCPSLGSRTGGIPQLLDKEFTFYRGAVNEICELFKQMGKEAMIEAAKYCFEKTKEYDKGKLEMCRARFYKEFSSEVTSDSRG